jgi:Flp pilus assembly protein TadG
VIPRLISRNQKDDEKGQNLVEFAMVVPIFLILVFSIVDFGMGFHAWITVTNAAREGARMGAVGADEATITARVEDTSSSLAADDLQITVTNAQGNPGESVTVQVEYQYQLITPLSNLLGMIGGGIGNTVDFSATSEMRLE